MRKLEFTDNDYRQRIAALQIQREEETKPEAKAELRRTIVFLREKLNNVQLKKTA